ncbi:hypothetical protein [Devosia sp. A449]
MSSDVQIAPQTLVPIEVPAQDIMPGMELSITLTYQGESVQIPPLPPRHPL